LPPRTPIAATIAQVYPMPSRARAFALSVLGRIRSVAVDRAGLVYLGSDTGDIWRLRPQ